MCVISTNTYKQTYKYLNKGTDLKYLNFSVLLVQTNLNFCLYVLFACLKCVEKKTLSISKSNVIQIIIIIAK